MPEEKPQCEVGLENIDKDAEEQQMSLDSTHRRLLWMLVLMNVLCALLFVWKEILH